MTERGLGSTMRGSNVKATCPSRSSYAASRARCALHSSRNSDEGQTLMVEVRMYEHMGE